MLMPHEENSENQPFNESESVDISLCGRAYVAESPAAYDI